MTRPGTPSAAAAPAATAVTRWPTVMGRSVWLGRIYFWRILSPFRRRWWWRARGMMSKARWRWSWGWRWSTMFVVRWWTGRRRSSWMRTASTAVWHSAERKAAPAVGPGVRLLSFSPSVLAITVGVRSEEGKIGPLLLKTGDEVLQARDERRRLVVVSY